MNAHLILRRLPKTPSTQVVPMGFSVCTRFISINHHKCTSSEPQLNELQVDLEEESLLEKEQNIERIRNKSKLKSEHRNILLNQRPFAEAQLEHHLTVKYNRKMFGKYGSESGVNPGILWPTKNDIQARKEYEKVAYPSSIQELVQFAQNEISEKDLAEQKQHDRVIANMTKLDLWKNEIRERIAKKEAEALAAREKKEKLIEEVRRHFGFTVDPREDRFKEMLAVKEKEQRKKDKQAKQEERERKAISKLMAKHDISMPVTEKTSTDKE